MLVMMTLIFSLEMKKKQLATLVMTMVFVSVASIASASFFKPDYYSDQCAELAFELAYEYQKFVEVEFQTYPASIAEYEDSSVVIDQQIDLTEKKFLRDKTHSVICGFDENGGIVDYQDPFDSDAVYEYDEPIVYNIVGEYIDIEDENCTLIEVSETVVTKLASGAAVGATLGISGGIIAIPVSGGLLVAAGAGGGAIIGGAVGGLLGGVTAVYHCVTK